MVMAVEATGVVGVVAMVMEAAAKVRVKPVTAAAAAVRQAVCWVVHMGAVLEEVVEMVATRSTRRSHRSYGRSIWWAKAECVLRTTHHMDAVAAWVATMAASVVAVAAAEVGAAAAVGRRVGS